MRRAKIVLLRLDYLLGTAIIICQILYIRQMVSILFYLSFLVSIALWICTTTESLDKLDRLTIAIIMLALIHVAINAAITDAVFSFEYLKKYIMFCCSMVFLSAIRRISLDRGTFRFLEVLFLIVGIFMLFMFFFRNQQMHLLNGRYTRYLTFRFNNPNLTALFLACMTMFLEVAAFQERRIPMKILLYAVAAAELVFLFLTKCAFGSRSFHDCRGLVSSAKEAYRFSEGCTWTGSSFSHPVRDCVPVFYRQRRLCEAAFLLCR